MNGNKAQETTQAKSQAKSLAKSHAHQQQQQGSASQPGSLNDRYGKIGISAVAGACQHKGEKRPATESRFVPGDSD